MTEYCIKLDSATRQDGSVFVTSPDLPMFSALGANEREALDLALKLLREYLTANVPEFVELRPVARANELWAKSEQRSILPAHLIATINPGPRNAKRTTKHAV